MQKKKTNNKLLWLLILHALLLFNSSTGILAKLASEEAFFSPMFLLLYGAEILVLFIYTIIWQQVIKHLPLTVAFCNKSTSMIWSTLWGITLFGEKLSANMVIGAVIVLVGVVLVVTADE